MTVYNTHFTPMRYAQATHGATTAMKLVCVGEDIARRVQLDLAGDQLCRGNQAYIDKDAVGVQDSRPVTINRAK